MDETNMRRIAGDRNPVTEFKKRTITVTEKRRGSGLWKESRGVFPFVETANKVQEIKGTGKSVRVELADAGEAITFRRVIYRYQSQRGMKFKTSIEGSVVWVSER